MYYRRKVLLALLQSLGGKINGTDFQKYLFLLNVEGERHFYHFIPYNFGCFSFQSYADKRALTYYNILKEKDEWEIFEEDISYNSLLKKEDKLIIEKIVDLAKTLKGRELVKYIYTNYPYYAINSTIAEKVVSSEDFLIIQELKKSLTEPIIHTLGYESIDIDAYVDKLINNNVAALVDVRRNPLSMKYGFSKKQLSGILEKVNISYFHIPELGIDSDDRKSAKENHNFSHLFHSYEESLMYKMDFIIQIREIYQQYGRIALTCFEKDHKCCHRKRITDNFSLIDFDPMVVHL